MASVKSEVYCKRCRHFKPPIQFSTMGVTSHCCNSCNTKIINLKPKDPNKRKPPTKRYTDYNITVFKEIYLTYETAPNPLSIMSDV